MSRGLPETSALGVGERVSGPTRMHAAREQHLGAQDVPHAGDDPLIEQPLSDAARTRGQAVNGVVGVGVGVGAKRVRAQPLERVDELVVVEQLARRRRHQLPRQRSPLVLQPHARLAERGTAGGVPQELPLHPEMDVEVPYLLEVVEEVLALRLHAGEAVTVQLRGPVAEATLRGADGEEAAGELLLVPGQAVDGMTLGHDASTARPARRR